MNRALPTAIALLIAILLQIGLAPWIAVFGVVPNVVLLVVVALALAEGPSAGCVAGFVGGLAFDLLTSGAVGPYALVFSVAGYAAGMLHANMFSEGWLQPVTVVFVAGLGTEIAHGLVVAILGEGLQLLSLLTVWLPAAVYNTGLAVLVFPLLTRALRRNQSVESLRRLG